MRISIFAALTAFAITLTGCEPSTTVRAQAARDAKDSDECPPLAKAQQLGRVVIAAKGTEKLCKEGEPCEVKVEVTLDNDGVCRANVEVEKVVIERTRDMDSDECPRPDPSKKGKRRANVPTITWKLDPQTRVETAKFEFHKDDGVRFLKKKEADEEDNDPNQDFHNPRHAKQKQEFAWDNKHCRKAKVRYCPYVFRVDKNPPEACIGGDPFILNQ